MTDAPRDEAELPAPTYQARVDGLALLARRDFSRADLIQRLIGRGHDQDASADAVEVITMQGFMNERNFAGVVCRQVLDKGPAAPRLLTQRLEQRLVDPQIIRETIEQYVSESCPIDDALEIARKRLKTRPTSSAGQIGGLLGRRGYDDEVICEVIERLSLDADTLLATPDIELDIGPDAGPGAGPGIEEEYP